MKQRWLIAVTLLIVILTGWLWTPDRSRSALETKYANGPGELINVAGIRLHVRVSGPDNAPAIIFLHGFGSSLQTWEAWARLLPDYLVVRYDLPGFALTGPDPTGDYSDARSTQVLLALMDVLHIDHATIVGHSLGGRIAWQFAAAQPHRVDKLVLIAPDGFASPGFEYGKKTRVPLLFQLMQYVLPKPLLKMSLAPGYADAKAMTDEAVNRYYDLILAPGVRAAILQRMQQTVLVYPPPILNRIRVPVLLVWGQQDQMIPVTNARDYQQALLNNKLVILPSLGHLLQEEAPSQSLPFLLHFLQQ